MNNNGGASDLPKEQPSHPTAWLSRGFEDLLHRLGSDRRPDIADYDVVIVGTGYGGAMAAATLAGCIKEDGQPVTVCVLERGQEYLPGMFPDRVTDLAGHLRFSTANHPGTRGVSGGLFDLRIGPDVAVLVGNGLGGGSLINAGVMGRPDDAVFLQSWPQAIATDCQRSRYYSEAEKLVGARDAAGLNTIHRHPKGVPPKYAALAHLAQASPAGPESFTACAITVAMTDKRNDAGVSLSECKRCGDCVTGCNHGAKDSLDVSVLVRAYRKNAELYTGATVLRLEQLASNQGWSLDVVHTEAQLRARQGTPLKLRAHKVILAAGTFGSPEILMRSRSENLKFSSRLGQRFSTNGDMIVVAYRQSRDVNAVADESAEPGNREIGPTITGMIDLRSAPPKPGEPAQNIVIEELAMPGALRPVFEETVTLSNTLAQLAEPDRTRHSPHHSIDPCAVDRDAIRRSSVFAIMGDDGARGALELDEEATDSLDDGAIRVRWPELRDHPLFVRQMNTVNDLTARSGAGGRILPNALWQILPPGLDFLADGHKGPIFTVHPLGGCAMGDHRNAGVVDDLGRVFDVTSPDVTSVHDDLIVLDGSIVPTALVVNPALTIAMLALRAAERLRAAWKFKPTAVDAVAPLPRPIHAQCEPRPTVPTEVEMMERMSGAVCLRTQGVLAAKRHVELTLRFKPKRIAELLGSLPCELEVDPHHSAVRIYTDDEWRKPETQRLPESDAPLVGTLRLLHREASSPWRRRLRGLRAWFWNRGLRDCWQALTEALRNGRAPTNGGMRGLVAWGLERVRLMSALATHAGEARLLEYDLVIASIGSDTPFRASLLPPGAKIFGRKRITYDRRANPWRQLMELDLSRFPGMPRGRRDPVLEVDLQYFADQGVPLMRITRQEDKPTALIELAQLALHFARILVSIHAWSFRKPDDPEPREPQRLPGFVPGLPEPVITELDVDELHDGRPVRIRLTRYPRHDSGRPPVVMIHGYSASGNTFAHHIVQPNLAGYLHERDRDVWILDLRTSSGMPTARHPWTFEDAAFVDLPAAFDHILRETGAEKLDVVAHCMGAAMLGMVVLAEPEPDARYYDERKTLPTRINRVVLSQVGPAVVFSPANRFRAFLLRHVRHVLPLGDYDFRVRPDGSLADSLINRLLATLPYPKAEFDIENPPWAFWRRTSFVGTRHRMDALYARDFELVNVDLRVMDYIDDLFGPLSIETVSQAIHFARLQLITDPTGQNVYVSRGNIRKRWVFPTLSVHGTRNGLSDAATLARMERIFREDAGVDYRAHAFPGFGHQDCLIGRGAGRVFKVIHDFLSERSSAPASAARRPPASGLLAEPPWIGPLLGAEYGQGRARVRRIAAACDPGLGRASCAVIAPVDRVDNHYQLTATPVWCCAIAPDDDGWFVIDVPVEQWAKSNAGVLMAVVYEAVAVQAEHGFSEGNESHPARRNRPGPATVRNPVLTDDTHRGAVEALIARRDAREFDHGIVPASPPASDPGTICFALASCQYTAGLLDKKPAYASYERLARRLDPDERRDRPEFLMLLGDQIYVDSTAGLWDPQTTHDRYVRPYEALYRNPHVRSVLRRIPAYMMLDDHEMEENWQAASADGMDPAADPRALHEGRSAYLRFQRRAGPPQRSPVNDSTHPLWYEFEANGFPFFVADVRTERKPRSATTLAEAKIMSDAQFERLTGWLDAQHENNHEQPKFIASSSMLLPRRREGARSFAGVLHHDNWEGYPHSFRRVLAHIADNGIKNVIFLSGDEHMSCIAKATLRCSDGNSVVVYSIHSSALYAPYPFANTAPDDLALADHFTFDDPQPGGATYQCEVSTDLAPEGDGYAVLRVESKPNSSNLHVTFDRDAATGGGSKTFVYDLV